MPSLEDVNRLKLGSYRIQRFDGRRLLVVGAHDLSYAHEVEISFTHVQNINCDVEFYDPVFQELGECPCGCSAIRVGIKAARADFEIAAMEFEVVLGTVYHYERQNLQPGERIATWVKEVK